MSALYSVSRRALLLIAFLALTLAILVARTAASASAQSGGGLNAKVVNKTQGAEPVDDLPVSVFLIQADGQTTVTQTIVTQGYTDARGEYIANDITGSQGASYVISTTYKGVAYRTPPISLPAQDVQLSVYETTEDESKIRISNAGVVIVDVDAELQRLRFLETATLLNSGDRTFVPSATGARGPMGLLRFSLPDGAGNLVVGEGLTSSEVIQVDTGFATDMPLLPGETNISYAYEMAYGALSEGGYALVSRNIAYPIDILQVLAVQGSFRVESPLLRDNGLATVGSHTYRQFSAQDLPAHSEVSFELRDLPLIQPVLRPGNAWLQASIATLALFALLVPIFYRQRHASRDPAPSTSSTSDRDAQTPAAYRTRSARTAAPIRRVANPGPPDGEPRA